MNYAIVIGQQAIMKAIFPSAIDEDLLKLMHLSNGFKMIPRSRPLKAGDVCCAEAWVVAVMNCDSGKTVQVSWCVLCKGNLVMEVQSAFFFHGHFMDYENTFKTIVNLFLQISVSACFNTLSHIQKDFFLPLNLCRLPLLLHHVQPSKTCIRKVWSSQAPPSLATHWVDSLPSLLLLISCQIPLLLTLCFIVV